MAQPDVNTTRGSIEEQDNDSSFKHNIDAWLDLRQTLTITFPHHRRRHELQPYQQPQWQHDNNGMTTYLNSLKPLTEPCLCKKYILENACSNWSLIVVTTHFSGEQENDGFCVCKFDKQRGTRMVRQGSCLVKQFIHLEVQTEAHNKYMAFGAATNKWVGLQQPSLKTRSHYFDSDYIKLSHILIVPGRMVTLELYEPAKC